MNIPHELHSIGKYQVIRPQARLNDIDTIADLNELVEALIDRDIFFIAIALENVSAIHSLFIKLLTVAYKKIKPKHGRLCLISPDKSTLDIMRILNLDAYIAVYPDEAAFRNAILSSEKGANG